MLDIKDLFKGDTQYVYTSQRDSKYRSRWHLQNGSFAFNAPDECSPVNPTPLACGLEPWNTAGFYECNHRLLVFGPILTRLSASSWEMSFYAPHAMAKVIELMGSNQSFITRL